jgi:hypothetical protein
MPEELQELWNENVEWTIESITVQQLSRVLTDLLECTKGTLKKNKKKLQLYTCREAYRNFTMYRIRKGARRK